jgi:hypothetical protein
MIDAKDILDEEEDSELWRTTFAAPTTLLPVFFCTSVCHVNHTIYRAVIKIKGKDITPPFNPADTPFSIRHW